MLTGKSRLMVIGWLRTGTGPKLNFIIINDDQQDATILDLFISSLLYMLLAIPSPIIRIT
jgi:hypothetical protein